MRAFFCFFFVLSWVLCAQEKPDFAKFLADFNLMKKEIGDAKDQTITIDFNWVRGHSQYLQKMVDTREWFIKNSVSPVDREAASNIDVQPLFDELDFVGKRLLVEKNVRDNDYTLKRVKETELRLLSQELNRFEQSGFIGPQELYRPSKILWSLGVIELVLADHKFVSRVCKDVEGCADQIAALQEKITTDKERAKIWMEKAKTNWLNPLVKPEPVLPISDPKG